MTILRAGILYRPCEGRATHAFSQVFLVSQAVTGNGHNL